MKATVRASQEKLEGTAEHYKEAPHVKAMHLNGLVSQASDLHGDPKGAMYEETNGAPENQYGDQHLVAAYHTLLKMQTKMIVSPCMSSSLPSNS
jgi:hypothetical protein